MSFFEINQERLMEDERINKLKDRIELLNDILDNYAGEEDEADTFRDTIINTIENYEKEISQLNLPKWERE